MTSVSPEMLVDVQLAAYNAHDLDTFAACYADEVTIDVLHESRVVNGIDQLRTYYADLWKDDARRAISIGRLVAGAVVIDHERVTRRDPHGGLLTFDAMVVFVVAAKRIARVTFIKP